MAPWKDYEIIKIAKLLNSYVLKTFILFYTNFNLYCMWANLIVLDKINSSSEIKQFWEEKECGIIYQYLSSKCQL